ncbi:MAG: aldolase/citrate lyase family protein [Planctomycetota bacterium]
MRTNKVKRALQEGKTVFGTMVNSFRGTAVVQMAANAGFDFLFIDMEHGDYNTETMADMIRTCRMCDIEPFVRVSDCQYHLMARPLDAGATGLMIPRVDTLAQAKQIIEWVKYPPVGVRGSNMSVGHSDFKRVGVKEFNENQNRELLTIIQIESPIGVRNVDKMAALDGIDAALIGPNDLSVTSGLPGQTDHPKMVKAMEQVVRACEKRGKAAGIHLASAAALKTWHEKGMRLLTWSGDTAILRDGFVNGMAELRKAIG